MAGAAAGWAIVQASVAVLLLGASLVFLPRAYVRVARLWWRERDVWSYTLLGAVAAAALVRWVIAPRWMVTLYIGFHITDNALALSSASHYGLGSEALYHALFAFLPHDHRVLMWINSVTGVVTIPLAATVALRLLRDRRAGAFVAVLAALVPLFVKNDNSDANNVPCLLWLMGGLVLWEEFLDRGARAALAGAVALLTLAAIARPEMPVLVPLLVALTTFGLAPSRRWWRDPALYVALAAAAVLLLPHVMHVRLAVDALEQRDSLPRLEGERVREIPGLLLGMNAVLQPSLFPVALTLLAALALFVPAAPKRARLALALMSFVAIAIYTVDLCRANMTRVQVPGALFLTMLAAAGISWAWGRHRFAPVVLVAGVLAAAVPTVPGLWAPTNEQTEEVFLRAALRQLPREPYTFVRLGRVDRGRNPGPAAATHDHFPDYLLRPPAGEGRPLAITDWAEEPDWSRPAFFYQGMRCYAAARSEVAPPHGDNFQPACARMHRDFALEPVLEQVVPNRGDVWHEYYGDAATLRLGLYRVRARR